MTIKPFGVVVVLAAVLIAVCEIAFSPMPTPDMMAVVINFFEIMLPVLATGALIKYLTYAGKKSCCKGRCGSGSCCYTTTMGNCGTTNSCKSDDSVNNSGECAKKDYSCSTNNKSCSS